MTEHRVATQEEKRKLCKEIQLMPGSLTVTIVDGRKRTLSQNNLMWAWVTEIANYVSDHTGYEKDEVHEDFKKRFLSGKSVVIDGMEVKHYSTKKLSTTEMTEYMDRIYRWATTELGLTLPLPPTAEER